MNSTVIFTAVVFVFVIGVLTTAAYAFFEWTPLAARGKPYRDPATGSRGGESLHLDEFRGYR